MAQSVLVCATVPDDLSLGLGTCMVKRKWILTDCSLTNTYIMMMIRIIHFKIHSSFSKGKLSQEFL